MQILNRIVILAVHRRIRDALGFRQRGEMHLRRFRSPAGAWSTKNAAGSDPSVNPKRCSDEGEGSGGWRVGEGRGWWGRGGEGGWGVVRGGCQHII